MPSVRFDPTFSVRQRNWLLVAAGALVLGSWWAGPIRPLWEALDQGFFEISNPLLGANRLWDGFWALTNHRSFDLVAALTMAAIFFQSGRTTALPSGRSAWSAVLIQALIGTLLGLGTKALVSAWLDVDRLSPTLLDPNSQRLSQLVDWIRAKDASKHCFPSDHGLVLFTLTLVGWPILKPWARIAACWGCVFFALPRLMSGAHWISDILAGSLPMAMIAVGLYRGLGLSQLIDRRVAPIVENGFRSVVPGPLRNRLDHYHRASL